MIDAQLAHSAFDEWQMYVPILRAKPAEWKVIDSIGTVVSGRLTPLVEFVPEWKGPSQAKRPRSPQSAADYVAATLNSLVTRTSSTKRTMLDFSNAGPSAAFQGVDLWAEFSNAVARNVYVAPVINVAHWQTQTSRVRAAVKAAEIVTIRVPTAALSSDTGREIRTIAGILHRDLNDIHVVVDLRDQPSRVSHDQIRTVLHPAKEFRRVTVAAGVFPRDLTAYQPGVTPEPREEWSAWLRGFAATADRDSIIGYGDYGTQCANYYPSPQVPGSVSLRYTTDGNTLVFRGRQSGGNTGLGHEQIHGHCIMLLSRQDYDGAAFSFGDHKFSCWANPANGPGNAEQWRVAGMNHHLNHVVAQLADPSFSSASLRSWARGQPVPACT